MKLPRTVYAIYPLNEYGSVAGVYVGSAHDVSRRIYGHLHTYEPKRTVFQRMMIDNGFFFQTFQTFFNRNEAHLEFDWMDFFRANGVTLFNQVTDCHSADWKRVVYYAIPKWTGCGVVWQFGKERTWQ